MLAEHATRQFLQKVPLFSQLDDGELASLTRVVRERHFKNHTTIVHVDDPGTALYILKSGLAKITLADHQGDEVILRLLYPTDFFGEMALLDGMPRSATITTQAPSTMLSLAREPFLDMLDQSPTIALKMGAVLCDRVRKANALIQSLIFFDAYGKVARMLLMLAAERGRITPQATIIDRRLTQHELAGLTGLRRETVARTLQAFQEAGCIRVDAGIISILEPELLRREMERARDPVLS
jgi:CRP/FNR family transcriptional regulator, cyclic AMP receptor protein